MEALEILEEHRRRLQIVRRAIHQMRFMKDRNNPFETLSETEFRRRFRLSKDSVLQLAEQLRPNLELDSRGAGLPVMIQVLVALRFYANGSFHLITADFFGIHESTACRVVQKLSRAIAALKPQHVYFPRRADHPRIKNRFSDLSRDNFPGIIGAIDCTHIPIICPSRDQARRFYNRKHFYSINCQVVCDADMNITNIVARWPGATHDSRIFRNSAIQTVLERGQYDGHLVGDSGYACTRYLLTPVLRERNNAERRYNIAHRRARNIVERLFGVWKRRFPCLQQKMRTKITTTQWVIIATAVLHNYANRRGDPDFEDEPLPLPGGDEVVQQQRDNVVGLQWRAQIINTHFM